MKRRTFLGAALSAGAFASSQGRGHAQEPAPDEDFDEFLSEIEALADSPVATVGAVEFDADTKAVIKHNAVSISSVLPQLSAARIAEIKSRDYWNAASKPSVAWPATNKAPDYAHLAHFNLASARFTLTAGTLRTLAARNSFQLSTARPVIVFGLRGCSIAGGAESSSWAAAHALDVDEPDHVNSRCVVGLWRQSDDQIAMYKASTVPAVKWMYTGLSAGGYGTSLLPTGLYTYGAGTHLASKPASIQRGALRISGDYVVLRTARDLSYDAFAETTFWTSGEAHNIHAGGGAYRFSCAGCQVIPGGYSGPNRRTVTGQWSGFQREAGLVKEDGSFTSDDASPSFLYMLLTGFEAALAAQGGAAFNNGYNRLRHGSSGPKVVALQNRLLNSYPGQVAGLGADGNFGMLTSLGVLLHAKRTTGEFLSPIANTT